MVPGGGEKVVFDCGFDWGIGASGWPGPEFKLGGTLMFGNPKLGTLPPGMPGPIDPLGPAGMPRLEGVAGLT